MTKVQLDIDEEVHLDVKILHAQIEKRDKKKKSLKETYKVLISKGLESLKKENPTK